MRPPAILARTKLAHGPYMLMCKSQDHIALRLLPGKRVAYCPTYLWVWEHTPLTRLMWEARHPDTTA